MFVVFGLKLQAVQGITSIYSLESKYVLAGKKDLKRCIPGSTGPDNGPCTLCIAGKYKAAVGSMPCTDCNAGIYSEDVGATSATACLDPLITWVLAGFDETCTEGCQV